MSYSYKVLAAEGCKVEYSAVWQDGVPYVIVAVSSDRLMFNDMPTMTVRLFDGDTIRLKGENVATSTSQGGVMVGNIFVPSTELKAIAQFPLSKEQVEMFTNGIAKVRISTIPLVHEHTYKKTKSGKSCTRFFRKVQHQRKIFERYFEFRCDLARSISRVRMFDTSFGL